MIFYCLIMVFNGLFMNYLHNAEKEILLSEIGHIFGSGTSDQELGISE